MGERKLREHQQMSEHNMAHNPQKAVLAAISAAVTSYIKQQEQETASTTAALAASVSVAARGVTSSLYGSSGRQQMMEMRRLLSLRLGRR